MSNSDSTKEADELATAVTASRAAGLEGVADGVVSTNEQGRVTSWNAKFLNIWGLPEEPASLRDIQKIREFIAQQLKDLGHYLARLAEIEASKEKSFDLLELIDGRLVERYSEVISAGGKHAGRVWSFRFVAERQHLDLVARRLAAIVDNSDDAIIGKDLNGIITSWNKAAKRIFGYSAEEMIGTSIMRLIPAERQAEEDEILSRIKRGERYDHFDTIRVSKDGRQLHVSLSISPIKDANGYVVGASKIARDITARKQAEKALEEARKITDAANAERQRLLESERAARSEAERANRMKDEFLATLSHELRTPLNAVLGWATTLRVGSPRTRELAEGLEAIERNARVQAQIISDLLDMSSIISGKVRLDVHRIDLPTIVAEAIGVALSSATRKSFSEFVIQKASRSGALCFVSLATPRSVFVVRD